MEGEEPIINFELKHTNPNFKFEKYLVNINDNSLGYSDRFEVFTYSKDNNQYILTPGICSYLIYIIRISDSQLFTSLKGHKYSISALNFFKNETNKTEEYILSADIKGILIIWDINNNFKIKHKFNTKEHVIYSSIILFNANNNKNNYIITSNSYKSSDENIAYSKIYSLSNGKFINNINYTNSNVTYYIIPWHDKVKDIHYEIECCLSKIFIINLGTNQIYHEFLSENEMEAFTTGFIYNRNEKSFLCSSSMHGEIKFWDLENKKLFKRVSNKDYNLLSMIQWSDKYIIFGDNNKNKSFKILDMDQFKIISNVGGKHQNPILCIKKINHCIYGDCLITTGTDKSIIIWSLK